MAPGDGNGWVTCEQGHRHWGLYGAAGLLVRAPLEDGRPAVLLQHRVEWSHHGGTWGLPGGARDSHESPEQAALREAHEEAGLDRAGVRVRAQWRDEHGGWAYTTVLAAAAYPLPVRPPGGESLQLRWVPEVQVPELELHPGFAASWSIVRRL